MTDNLLVGKKSTTEVARTFVAGVSLCGGHSLGISGGLCKQVERVEIFRDKVSSARRLFNEDYFPGAATQGFDAQRTGSGIEIENSRTTNRRGAGAGGKGINVDIGGDTIRSIGGRGDAIWLEHIEKREFFAGAHRMGEGGFGRAETLTLVFPRGDAEVGSFEFCRLRTVVGFRGFCKF